MRLLVLTTSYPRFPGDDAGIFVERLIQAIAKKGVSCRVIVPWDGREPEEEERNNIKISRFRYGVFTQGRLCFGSGILPNIQQNPFIILQIPTLLIGFLRALWRYRSETDVVQANWIFAGIAAWIFGLITKKPFIITLRGEDVRLVTARFLKVISPLLLKNAKKVVTVSDSVRDRVISALSLDPNYITTIPNGVSIFSPSEENKKGFLIKYNLDTSALYLLYIGRVIPLKNLEFIYDLLSQSSLSSLQLIIAGRAEDSAYQEKLSLKAEQYGIYDRVHLLGPVPPDEVPALLSVATYFINPSISEGRPNTVIEALAAGKVVLASKIAAHEEIIKNGDNGWLFDLDGIQQAETVINEMENHASERIKIEQRAKESVKNLSWERAAKCYIEELGLST